MGLLWTLIIGFLYAEIAVVICLVFPIGSPRKWDRFFKSNFLSKLSKKAQAYFIIVMSVLLLLLLDAFLEMRKYSNEEYRTVDPRLNSKMPQNTRLFRAQRNFYVSGFAIFLMLVIRRLVTLISIQASLLTDMDSLLQQKPVLNQIGTGRNRKLVHTD
uniref:Endoplasmic reticulum transmembrane protein n=1 Tax=Glossina pallidipes TaxID=7398 RepID=A0A1A9ZRG5_GLOPL